jgi:hypothetical protein
MGWFISGNCEDIVLSASESGALTCHGGTRHDFLNDSIFVPIDGALLKRIQGAKPYWSMFTPAESDALIDPSGLGLFTRVRNAPDLPHGMITFYEQYDTVEITLVLPPARYIQVQRLLELVLQSPSLEYTLFTDFRGCRAPTATTDTPTWDQFSAGTPYFFQESSLTVRRSKVDG